MKSLFTFLLFSFLFFPVAHSQTINVKKLDSLFNILESRGLANGSVTISIKGKLAYQKAIGFAIFQNNNQIKPDINTKYRIGSVSKMFTAVLIFQLIDEKKLSLQENLARYFPGLPNANKISIRELLYHRSGLHDYTRDTNFPEWMDEPKSQEEMLKVISNKGADFDPGSKAEYSNTNYLLLSYIIQHIRKKSYADALNTGISSKIGLSNTYYGKPMDIRRNEAASYKYNDSTWKKETETDLSIHSGAGSIISTPTDLTRFMQQLFGGKLISRASLDSMKTMVEGYGMGIFPYDFGSRPGYGHNGRIEEFYSAVRYYPGKDLAISYITNGILFPRMDILQGIMKICMDDDYQVPFSKPVRLRGTDLDKYLGTYSSNDLPFTVTCKKKDAILLIEAAGRSMEAEPVMTNYFMNLKTGSFFEFNPAKGELQIKETDNIYNLHLER